MIDDDAMYKMIRLQARCEDLIDKYVSAHIAREIVSEIMHLVFESDAVKDEVREAYAALKSNSEPSGG